MYQRLTSKSGKRWTVRPDPQMDRPALWPLLQQRKRKRGICTASLNSSTMTIWTAVGNALQPLLRLLESITPSAPKQPVLLPRRVTPQPPTSPELVEKVVVQLDQHKTAWVRTPCRERAKLLRRCMDSLMKVEEELARASIAHKGSYGIGIGEERAALLPVMVGLTEYCATMRAGGAPKPLSVRERRDGQLVVEVFPIGPIGILMPSFRGEVWIQPGRPASQGELYRRKARGEGVEEGAGGVALVLGAGNQVAVVALDVLHKLITDDEVVVVKTNPVNDYIGPLLRRAFAPLVEAGFLEFVYGGRDIGELLTHHPLITSVHLTGSVDTYNAIVWGSTGVKKGPRTATKRITAELGNVTPYIIVPGGEWTSADIEYHATGIATALAHNAGHNCNGLEVLVTDREWHLRPALLAAVKAKLAALPAREPWYPGSREKYDRFLERFPSAEQLGSVVPGPRTGAVPWLVAEGLTLEQGQLQQENWCGVMQEVALPGCGGDPERFMRAAAHAVSTHIFGSLAAGVICHPRVQAAHPQAWDDFLASLRYGSIAINTPLVVSFGQTGLTWGAYPGNTPHDIGSGVGVVHNTLLLDYPQKSVLHGPWQYHPRPFWFVDNGAAGERWLLPAVMRFLRAVTDRNLLAAGWWLLVAAAAALRG